MRWFIFLVILGDRDILKLRWILILIFVLSIGFRSVAQQSAQHKNVLFILVDDLRPNLGCYDDRKAYTPNIDRLASRGIVFTNAYCQQAICNPSRTSMLTGLRPDETGVYDLQTHFREAIPHAVTLPQYFKNQGYFAASTGKIFHNSKSTQDPVSWTKVESVAGNRTYLLSENRGKGKQKITEVADVLDTAYTDGKIAESAISLLSEASQKEAPFFIAVGFIKPHAPFCAPKSYWDLYSPSLFTVTDRDRPIGSPDLAFHHWEELRGYRDIPVQGELSPDQEQRVIHGYYACISYIDAQIGRILKELETLGLVDQTIVVLWGDHGYHLGEQGLWCKSTNFELDTRVPLIVSAPGLARSGEKVNAMVESVDIYPTLTELCGLNRIDGLSGISLMPLLEDPSSPWKYPAFSQFVRPYNAAIHKKDKASHVGYSIRVPGWRCTYWYDLTTNIVVERELYQLDDAGSESENIAGQPGVSAIERRLAALIDQYRSMSYLKKDMN